MAQQHKCGGMGNVQEATPEVQGYLDQVKAAAESKAGRTFATFQAVAFATQLVNGTNYFIKANTGDGKYVFIRLHKPIRDDKVSFASLQDGKTESDEIVYF